MKVFKKTYIGKLTHKKECPDRGSVVGTVIVSVWFWQSPITAYNKASGRYSELMLMDFKRIK